MLLHLRPSGSGSHLPLQAILFGHGKRPESCPGAHTARGRTDQTMIGDLAVPCFKDRSWRTS
ncbi:hypothetical protein AB0N09_43110, partial [Streptomyces erythrochromogenes]|uniref:hypothetical protein n=1 Tax=Streptomyces erythrochromogenes TaxID=285574 RepID=UPI0034127997